MRYQNIVLLALSVSGIILLSVVIVANRSRQTYRSQASESLISPSPTPLPDFCEKISDSSDCGGRFVGTACRQIETDITSSKGFCARVEDTTDTCYCKKSETAPSNTPAPSKNLTPTKSPTPIKSPTPSPTPVNTCNASKNPPADDVCLGEYPGDPCTKDVIGEGDKPLTLAGGRCVVTAHVSYIWGETLECTCDISPKSTPTPTPLPRCESLGGVCIDGKDLSKNNEGQVTCAGFGDGVMLPGECRSTTEVCCLGGGGGNGVDNPSFNEAGRTFKIRLPNIDPTIQSVSVKVSAYYGSNPEFDDQDTVTLQRDGDTDYFKTPQEIVLQVTKDAGYSIYVKGTTTLARLFKGVSLTRGRTTSCISDSDTEACGELVSARDTKYLYGGDSDGFTETSDSYNTIDIVDLAQLAIYYEGTAQQGDFNGDGVVDIVDLSILAINYERFGDKRIYEQK